MIEIIKNSNITIFIVSFIISVIIIPIILYFSKKFNLYDRIDERKIHTGDISRLGGLAIFSGFLITFIIISFKEVYFFNIYIYITALMIVFLTGFLDDIWNIKARYKLILQIISGILVASSGLIISNLEFFGIFSINFGVFSYLITVLWIIIFMNAINLLDGMDGLASGIVFIANIFVFFIALSYNNILVTKTVVILAGSILGFYIFNFPPAKIFMGDSGAYFLGFMYSTLPLMGIKKSAVATIFLIPLILLIIPIGDIILVIFKRLKSGGNIFLADKNHLHHRLMNLGLSTRGILFVIYIYTIILGLTSILMLYIQPGYSLILFTIIFLLVLISFYLLNSAENIINGKNGDE